MKKVAIFLTDGFDEIEVAAPLDILERGQVKVDTISIFNKDTVVGSRGLKVVSDMKLSDFNYKDYDLYILPGGPGASSYYENTSLKEVMDKIIEEGRYMTAICAGPTILANYGYLDGKNAVCFPPMNEAFSKNNATFVDSPVVVDGNIITGRSAAAGIPFGLKLLEILEGEGAAYKVAGSIFYEG